MVKKPAPVGNVVLLPTELTPPPISPPGVTPKPVKC